MDELVEQMKVVLASAFSLYLKAHYFHWNVEGPNFPQYHSFMGDFYEEVYGSIDTIAEEMRALGAYAPGSLKRFSELSKIEDETAIPDAARMIKILFMDNQIVLDELAKARELAESANKYGLVNFLEDRLDKHSKHQWMLRSTIKA
jgi:starvation-inducible DNA-binding protein